MPRLVSTREQVVANIRKFEAELNRSTELQARLGQVHSWYALKTAEGRWLFGSSKFIGYENNSAKKYLETADQTTDGRETERLLEAWYSPVEPSSRTARELQSELAAFLSQWNRKPRKDARISVVIEDTPQRVVEKPVQELLARIHSDPAICGGRPIIKGTRVRVSDIVDMVAAGASRHEILEDFPYLMNDDISAALNYAARATDHRIISAA